MLNKNRIRSQEAAAKQDTPREYSPCLDEKQQKKRRRIHRRVSLSKGLKVKALAFPQASRPMP